MLVIAVWFVIVATVPAWAVTLFKLLPAYRARRVRGGYRTMFQVLIALLTWYTSIVLVVFIGGNTTLGAMLSVVWAIGFLTWTAVSAVASTRRVVTLERDTVSVDPAQHYTVRTTPKATVSAPKSTAKQRSARAQQVLRKVVI